MASVSGSLFPVGLQKSAMLLTPHVLGDTHKKQRKMLNGVFSTKHIKNLTPTFYEVSHRVRAVLDVAN